MRPRGAALLLLLAALSSVYVPLGTASSTTITAYLLGLWSRTHRHSDLSPAPAPSPGPQGASVNHPVHRHHRKRPRVAPPSSSPSFERQDCSGITCYAPLTSTPIGSPCGCVYPMQIQLDLSVAPYQLFPRVDELEIEIAAGTFLKQSQVRIMGAGGSIQDPDKTTVTIDLVPLGQKFDRTSALLISNRFLRKKVPIKPSIFGDYDVTYVHYPGLPSSVPNIPGSLAPISSNEYPFGANVHNGSHPKISSKIVTIIALSAVVLVLTCFGICIICKYKGRRKPHGIGHASNSSNTRKTGMRSSFSSMTSSTASFPSTIATCPPTVKTFSISELEKATDKFSFNRIIGEGGYGRVYRGIVQDGVEVAVKLLTGKHQNRDREFIAEVEMLSRLHHRNLVKMIGICVERRTRCLVFELVPNGSVESHLHGSDKIYGPLDFDTRMKIALGAARGLAYLHEDANPHVIHRDFKASNVLLENDFTAKVADFGLAKEASEGIEHISTQVMGTFGYVAPEYAMTGHLLVKSDVYSYGVVLLELLSGRKLLHTLSLPRAPHPILPLLSHRSSHSAGALTPPTTAPPSSAALHHTARPAMAAAAAALASSPLVHLTAAARVRFPRPRPVASSRWGCPRGAYLDWRPLRRCDRMRRFSVDEGGGGGEDGEKRGEEEAAASVEAKVGAAEELGSERSRSGSFSSSSSPSSATPGVSSEPPLLSFSVDNIDTVKLLELLGPEKVDPVDVKAIKEKFFGYTTFWLTREEPFGDLGEGVLFVGNLRGDREEIFGKLQQQLRELTGDKYNLFMVEEPNSEEDDPRGGPRVSFGLLRREVSEPGPTTLWQYVISLLLFLLTVFSCIELGIASKISSLPPDIVSYFTDPNATGPPPDMQLLLPFVESALPVAYGVLAIQLFHEIGHILAAYPKKVKLGIPFFIPNFTLGTFGSITQFKSILPDRKTMFDVSMAGPLAGAALSFSMFSVGLWLSSNPAGATDLVQVPSNLFQGSLLLGLISRAILGYSALHAATVSIHPLVIAGWCGLTTTAFNMLPVGCLDGGRGLQGAFGKDALFGFGLTTYSLLGLGVLGGPLSLPWGLYVLLCQRTPEKPCLDDVSDVGAWRRGALIASVFLVVLILIPLWDELAEDLGVGLVSTF